MAAERDVHSSLIESQRLYHLDTEIYCDRAGALVAGWPGTDGIGVGQTGGW